MSQINQILPFYLNQALGTSETSFDVKQLKDSRGNLIIAMPTGVANIIVTIEPQSSNNQEIISFTGITNKGNGIVTLTGVTRNLNPVSPYTALTPAVSHSNNATCIISNSPQTDLDVVKTNETRTVSSVVTFTASPIVPDGVNPTDAVNKSQLDAVVAGTIPASSTTVYGSVRMASSQIKTIGTATMTIASPCVVTFTSHGLIANDIIYFTTTSALPTGITANTQYYVMATGLTANTFQLSATSSGSAINTSGSQSGVHTLYRATPYAVNDQDGRLPTQSENDALAGTSGTPSSSNKFVTDADTSTTLSGTKAIRANAGVYPAGDGSAITGLSSFLISGAPSTVTTNTTATVLTYALAGGTLSTNKGVRMRFSTLSAITATNGVVTYTVAYGGTTICTFGYNGNSGTPTVSGLSVVDIVLLGAGTTGTQRATTINQTVIVSGSGGVAGSNLAQVAALSIDSTTSQNITVSCISQTSTSGTFYDYLIQKIS